MDKLKPILDFFKNAIEILHGVGSPIKILVLAIILAITLLWVIVAAIFEITKNVKEKHERLMNAEGKYPRFFGLLYSGKARFFLLAVVLSLFAIDWRDATTISPPVVVIKIPAPIVKFGTSDGKNYKSDSSPKTIDQEIRRRYALLDKLRNQYILQNPASNPDLLAKKTYPPPEWINTQLKAIGETWRYEDRDHPFKVNKYEAMTNLELQTAGRQFAAKLREWKMPEFDFHRPLGESNEDFSNRLYRFDQQMNQDFETRFLVEGRALDGELTKRDNLHDLVQNYSLNMSVRSGLLTLQTGMLAGANPVQNLANYFDWLADQMPIK